MNEPIFLWRLLICTFSIILLVKLYFHFSKHRNNAASFMLFGVGVFLVTGLLHNADVSMGFAFGLFAIFSMLRYRTEAIDIKEMTYLFLVIAIALLSAVSKMNYYELLSLNGFIIILAFVLETQLILPIHEEKVIEYEVIENIKPENEALLIADLESRTGLNITRVKILSISFLKDTAMLQLHFVPEKVDE